MGYKQIHLIPFQLSRGRTTLEIKPCLTVIFNSFRLDHFSLYFFYVTVVFYLLCFIFIELYLFIYYLFLTFDDIYIDVYTFLSSKHHGIKAKQLHLRNLVLFKVTFKKKINEFNW